MKRNNKKAENANQWALLPDGQYLLTDKHLDEINVFFFKKIQLRQDFLILSDFWSRHLE